jgi:hypothetical protein
VILFIVVASSLLLDKSFSLSYIDLVVDNIVSHGHHQTPTPLLEAGLQDNLRSRSFGTKPCTLEKVAGGASL